ncbi:unnamed protein product [Lactuca virosa]|uniref:Uncharacterized protein n=1 Tax=Lactuca virosa TaxID=75947 RepID=A0AAU9MJ09_9ASTR|nr:unnamed protein product [Lactuca virosa]
MSLPTPFIGTSRDQQENDGRRTTGVASCHPVTFTVAAALNHRPPPPAATSSQPLLLKLNKSRRFVIKATLLGFSHQILETNHQPHVKGIIRQAFRQKISRGLQTT